MLIGQREKERNCFQDFLSCTSAHRYTQKFARYLSMCEYCDWISDRPDIVLRDNQGCIYGIEHFRVSSALKKNSSNNLAKFKNNEFYDSVYDAFTYGHAEWENGFATSDVTVGKLAKCITTGFDVDESCSYFHYMKSFQDGTDKHVNKILKYRQNLASQFGSESQIKLYFMIEVYFPFRRMGVPVTCGCITNDVIDYLWRLKRQNVLLDGVIFVMRNITVDIGYSTVFIDFSNFEKSIRKQHVVQNHVKDRFHQVVKRNIDCEDYKLNDDGSVTFLMTGRKQFFVHALHSDKK